MAKVKKQTYPAKKKKKVKPVKKPVAVGYSENMEAEQFLKD